MAAETTVEKNSGNPRAARPPLRRRLRHRDRIRFAAARPGRGHRPRAVGEGRAGQWMTNGAAAYRHWLTMPAPHWARLDIGPIDFRRSAATRRAVQVRLGSSSARCPRRSASTRNWCEVPRHRGADRRQLFRRAELGGVLRRQLRVHPRRALPDGAQHLFPHQRRNTGQFERTLIIAECRRLRPISKAAPRRCATRTSCTPRWSNWSRSTTPRSSIRPCRTGTRATRAAGGIYNFVTKRATAARSRSKISWTQVETGSAITWKYPSCILRGDDSVGEFYSVALTNHRQQADTGTKMIHLGKRTRRRSCRRASRRRGQKPIALVPSPKAEGAQLYRSAIRC